MSAIHGTNPIQPLTCSNKLPKNMASVKEMKGKFLRFMEQSIQQQDLLIKVEFEPLLFVSQNAIRQLSNIQVPNYTAGSTEAISVKKFA